MANLYSDLDHVFHALSDPTRRAVVQRLGQGSATVTELAAPFGMALPSFMKHISVLERSRLIRTTKVGRIRTCQIDETPFAAAQNWLTAQKHLWEARTDRLAAFVESSPKKD